MTSIKKILKMSGVAVAAIFLSVNLFAQENVRVVEDGNGNAYYTIQKGDTLWDLSRKFLNSPWYWPELWQLNSADVPIPNPHLIYPGQRIRLVNRHKLPPSPRSPEPLVTETLSPQPLQMPPPLQPASAPAPVVKKDEYYAFSLINQVGFIRQEPVDPLGKIFKVQGGKEKEMIHKGDVIYVKETGTEPLTVGGSYVIYRTSSPLKDEKTGALIGTQHMITGTTEILKKEPDFVLAKVTESFRAIKTDDLLMPYNKRATKIKLEESPAGISGKILFSEEHTVIMGQHQIVFIDKGEADGVKVGQSYMIYEQEKAAMDPQSTAETLLTPSNIGTVLVLLTQPTTSTALITYSIKDISNGEKISSPVHEK
jgi:hypothetical protein